MVNRLRDVGRIPGAAQKHMLTGASAREAKRLLESLCDPTRLKILRAPKRTPVAASNLATVIGRTRSATSQHLRVLREADAVVPERKGNVVRYRLGGSITADVLADICDAFDRVGAAAAD